mgnify:CR=1 FL=1
MIFRWTEETRAADASLSTCVSACVGKARARSRPATFGRASRPERGAGRAAERASTGPRRTVHGGKDVCGFRARAPEDGASRRAERLLRSSDPEGGGETRVCRHTPKVTAVYKSGVPGEV